MIKSKRFNTLIELENYVNSHAIIQSQIVSILIANDQYVLIFYSKNYAGSSHEITGE